jgi:hypothetical protein
MGIKEKKMNLKLLDLEFDGIKKCNFFKVMAKIIVISI